MRFMRKEAKELKEDYKKQAWEQWQSDVLDCELEIEIDLYFGDKRKRDWDNFHKLSMDALTDIVWIDDSQVKKATVCLYYDKTNPRTEIKLYTVSTP